MASAWKRKLIFAEYKLTAVSIVCVPGRVCVCITMCTDQSNGLGLGLVNPPGGLFVASAYPSSRSPNIQNPLKRASSGGAVKRTPRTTPPSALRRQMVSFDGLLAKLPGSPAA